MKLKNGFFVPALIVLFTMSIVAGCSNSSSTAPASGSDSAAHTEETSTDGSSRLSSASQMSPVVVDTSVSAVKAAQASVGSGKIFSVYSDGSAPDNHFAPSGWMGDYSDLKMNDKFTSNPHAGSTCIQVVYSNKASNGARWAGIYWQNPPNNWGTRPGGYDLTGATKLTFWARGEKGGERIEEFKIGGITGEFSDSDVAGIGPAVLTAEWQQFTIDLAGKNLSSINGGFCWATNLDVNPDGATFYLDDIRYE